MNMFEGLSLCSFTTMRRPRLSFSVLFSIYITFLFPFVYSQLSTQQNATMIEVSQILNSTASWDIKKQPNPCAWNGVDCDSKDSSILRISLSGYSLSSSDFFPLFCQIDSLQVLDFSNNFISSIPDGFFGDCGKINGLHTLNFSRNKMVDPLPTFVGFVGLKFLDFSYNMMSGSIDGQLNELVNLTILNLSANEFSGLLPVKLGKSKNLELLELSRNRFHGRIPESIIDYENLTLIDLSYNQLSGSLPARIGELTKLESLILSANNFSGEIPHTLSSMSTLLRFAASQNNFAGKIPEGIATSVENLDLSYNILSGLIPSNLLSHQNLQTVDLSNNLLEGTIPVNLSRSLVRLSLGRNQLSGMIPEIVETLTNLKYLELDNNNLSGIVPPQLGFCRKLLLLNLAQNNLIGDLPAELGNLSNLEILKLQSNKLAGVIPIQITELKELAILNVSWNFLNGWIPSAISSLEKLSNLNLQGNKLSGFIPNSINSMNSLSELQLSSNELTSPIPMMPPNLQIALNLSSNHFEGQIPDSLALLQVLEVLDLSNNSFSGETPVFMTQMLSMTHLTLSDNNLSGVIPKFMSWVEVETSGNPYLINITLTGSVPSVKRRSTVTVAIIVAVAVAACVFLVGVIIVIAMLISRHYEKVTDMKLHSTEDHSHSQVFQNNLLTSNGIHASNIDFATSMEKASDPSNVELKTRFSTYYKADMPSGSSYYVKKLNWNDKLFQVGGRHGKFKKELEVLGRLYNANVMTPLAYTLTLENAYLFYEYALIGSLSDVLHGGLEITLNWTSRYSIAIGVAQGLSFLQGCPSGPIILLDLSSKNIFLKSLREPLIGDIELCKVIDPTKSTGSLSAIAGTFGFIPPEYAYTMRITMAGNIYSFGVILLELLTGKPAASEGTELTKLVSSYSTDPQKWDEILDISISRTSPATKSQMLAVLKIALACVCASPGGRPKTKSVLRMLLNAR